MPYISIIKSSNCHRNYDGRNVKKRERLPDWEGPYDYSNQEQNFRNFKALHDTIACVRPQKIYDPRSRPQLYSLLRALDSGPTDLLRDRLLASVRSSPGALKYLVRIAKRMSADKRCLFVLASGFVGTGPTEMRNGDEVFLIAGVPCPMVPRKNVGKDTFRVVGAVLVHGLMHGEAFKMDELQDITLV